MLSHLHESCHELLHASDCKEMHCWHDLVTQEAFHVESWFYMASWTHSWVESWVNLLQLVEYWHLKAAVVQVGEELLFRPLASTMKHDNSDYIITPFAIQR